MKRQNIVMPLGGYCASSSGSRRGSLKITRLRAHVRRPSIELRCPSSCARTAVRYWFVSRPRVTISVSPQTAAPGCALSTTNHCLGGWTISRSASELCDRVGVADLLGP